MKIAINKEVCFDPYLNDAGVFTDSNSTETNLLVAKCLPARKRKKMLLNAIEQANLEDDELFVMAFEALTGLKEVFEEKEHECEEKEKLQSRVTLPLEE